LFGRKDKQRPTGATYDSNTLGNMSSYRQQQQEYNAYYSDSEMSSAAAEMSFNQVNS
jgi:hypothetical protein